MNKEEMKYFQSSQRFLSSHEKNKGLRFVRYLCLLYPERHPSDCGAPAFVVKYSLHCQLQRPFLHFYSIRLMWMKSLLWFGLGVLFMYFIRINQSLPFKVGVNKLKYVRGSRISS